MDDVQPTYIEIRTTRSGTARAFLTGTRIKVHDVAIEHERFGATAEEIAGSCFPHLSLAQVHASLAYFFENQARIRAEIRADDQSAEQLLKELGVIETGQPDVRAAPLSSR